MPAKSTMDSSNKSPFIFPVRGGFDKKVLLIPIRLEIRGKIYESKVRFSAFPMKDHDIIGLPQIIAHFLDPFTALLTNIKTKMETVCDRKLHALCDENLVTPWVENQRIECREDEESPLMCELSGPLAYLTKSCLGMLETRMAPEFHKAIPDVIGLLH